jgi:hypothetical protein
MQFIKEVYYFAASRRLDVTGRFSLLSAVVLIRVKLFAATGFPYPILQ